MGQERVTAVNQMVDELIDYGHSEAATIAEWKDGVNEAWADLLELMETRAQMLAASHQLHKFFSDCREVRKSSGPKRHIYSLFLSSKQMHVHVCPALCPFLRFWLRLRTNIGGCQRFGLGRAALPTPARCRDSCTASNRTYSCLSHRCQHTHQQMTCSNIH